MIIPVLIFIAAFWFLHHTTSELTRQITILSLLTTKSPRFGLVLYSLFFFPGTFLHEFSHAITAALIGVPVGHINLFPRIDPTSKHFQLGSVQIAKTDFIRQTLVGLAPTIFGLSSITLILLYSFPSWFDLNTPADILVFFSSAITHLSLFPSIGLYLIFTIASTLHTSDSDRRTLPIFVIVFIIISSILIGLFGLPSVPALIASFARRFFILLGTSLVFTVMLNLLALMTLHPINFILSRLLSRRIVSLD